MEGGRAAGDGAVADETERAVGSVEALRGRHCERGVRRGQLLNSADERRMETCSSVDDEVIGRDTLLATWVTLPPPADCPVIGCARYDKIRIKQCKPIVPKITENSITVARNVTFIPATMRFREATFV